MNNSGNSPDSSFEEVPSPTSLVIEDRGEFAFFRDDDEEGMASTSTSGPKMTAPKFGAAHGNDYVWVGGAPLSKWTGSCLTESQTPMAFRGTDPMAEQKGYTKRTSGLETKFKRDDPDYSLTTFAADALTHMQTHGMDTVFYMKTADAGIKAGSSTGAMEVFTYHTRFTKGEVEAAINQRINNKTFDPYCVKALSESATWLQNSIDPSLKQSIRSSHSGIVSGPVFWMLIVAEVQSDSLRRCVVLAAEFESLSLTSVRGENVQEYCIKANNILVQLEKDDQLPSTHLLKLVDVFSGCSVMDFKVQWMGRRVDVERFVRESSGKSKEVIVNMPNYIHFQHLLDSAKSGYTNLKHLWGPSADGKPTQESALIAKLDQMEAMIATLNSGKTGETGKDDSWKNRIKCNYCKEVGHLKKDCPKAGSTKGDYSEPKDGETTRTIDGKLRKWCTKCRRRGAKASETGMWTTTHTTADHVNKSSTPASATPDSANLAEWLHLSTSE